MSGKRSDGRQAKINRSLTVPEYEQTKDKKENNYDDSSDLESPSLNQNNIQSSSPMKSPTTSVLESDRQRSKTVATSTSDFDFVADESARISSSAPMGFNFLQSIKDLTHQELYRANPLGLLGKEIISVTGTTHCPEPIPPIDDEKEKFRSLFNCTSTSSSIIPTKLSTITENQPQRLHFPLDINKHNAPRRRSTLSNVNENVLPPYPVDFMGDSDNEDVRPYLFTHSESGTMVADFIPDTMTINVFEVFIYAWGVIAFFFDMVTDIVLAHAYYLDGAYWLFILTLMCVVVPNLTLSVFSLVWYIDGSQLKAAANEKETSIYEANSMNDVIKTESKKTLDNINENVELIPTDKKRNSTCQTDMYNEQDQTDAYPSRLKQRLQTPEKDLEGHYQNAKKPFQLSSATANIITWIIRIIILVLQLDLCLKYIRGLYYTWKGFQKRHHPKWARFYLTKQILIDADIALLRVFDCFMDSGSQVTLQLYIMLRLGSASMKFDTLFLKQCLSIISSLGSLAYALSGYSRCWRHMQLTHSPQDWPKGKPPPQLVSWWSTIIQWFWYLFLITPRVLALAMFAATFRSWFWIILAAHWWGMLFWILRFRTIFCISDQTKYNAREAIFEKCYNLVCSYIFIFCYMNLRKGDTRTHYIGFYTIYFIENIAFSIIYAIHSAETNTTFKYSLVTFVCCGFWLALLFQFFYYRFLHPSDHVRRNTKRNLSSLVHIRVFKSFNQSSNSKSSEDTIDNNEISTVKISRSADERWYNRFSKDNRQKLISQQQAIDQKVKYTRAQKQLEAARKRHYQPKHSLLTQITTKWRQPTKVSTILVSHSLENINFNPTNRDNRFHVPHLSLTTSQHQEAYSKIHQDDDEDEKSNRPSSSSYQLHQQTEMSNVDQDKNSSNEYNVELHSDRNNTTPESNPAMNLIAPMLTTQINSCCSSSSFKNNELRTQSSC